MKTQKIKNIKIISLAVFMSAFTMFSSFADTNTYNKKKFDDKVIIEGDSIKKRLSELENLIIELLSKWDDLVNSIECEFKSEVTIETWMFDNNYFNTDTEESLVIEDWMLDEDYFSKETVEESVIEDWMLDNNYFTIETEMEKSGSQIEPWMLSEDYFEVEEEDSGNMIESWMLNDNYFDS